jgi:hypothetical protein
MRDSIADPSTDNASAPTPCDHHWVSSHEPGLSIWVVQCSMCGRFNAKDMQEQIDSNPQQWAGPKRPITAAALRSHLKAAAEYSNRVASIREETSPYIPVWAARASLELEWARSLAAVMVAERTTGGEA